MIKYIFFLTTILFCASCAEKVQTVFTGPFASKGLKDNVIHILEVPTEGSHSIFLVEGNCYEFDDSDFGSVLIDGVSMNLIPNIEQGGVYFIDRVIQKTSKVNISIEDVKKAMKIYKSSNVFSEAICNQLISIKKNNNSVGTKPKSVVKSTHPSLRK